jgi:hypothetical protein
MASSEPLHRGRAASGRFEIPLAALGAAVAFSALFVIPLFGALGVPLAAIPLVRLAHRRGLASALLACAGAVGIVLGTAWAAAGLGTAVAMAFVAAGATAIPVAGVGFLRAGAEASRCYLGIGLAGCAFLAAGFVASTTNPGPSVAAEVGVVFDQMIPSALESYSRSGADAETVARMRQTLEAARDFSRQYLWGIFGALWMLGGAVAFYGGAAASRPAPTAVAARFEELRVPASAAAFFVAAGAGFGLLPGDGRRVAGNVLLPLVALFFVAGLSIICHFFRRWIRVRVLRGGLYALAAYFPINIGVVLLGLFDWYVDFRRRGEGVIEKS